MLPDPHPAVVHFPIAFLLLAAAVDVLAVALPRRRALAAPGVWLWPLGALGAGAAYGTGYLAWRDLATVEPAAVELLEEHRRWALGLLVASVVCAALRVLVAWRRGLPGPSRRVLGPLLVLEALVAGLVVGTASRGGQAVYRHGAGVAWRDAVPAAAVPDDVPFPAAGGEEALLERVAGTEREGLEVSRSGPPVLSVRLPGGIHAFEARLDGETASLGLVGPRLTGVRSLGLRVDPGRFRGRISLTVGLRGGEGAEVTLVEEQGELRLEGAASGVLARAACTTAGPHGLELRLEGGEARGLVDGEPRVRAACPVSGTGLVALSAAGQGTLRWSRFEVRAGDPGAPHPTAGPPSGP